MKDPMRYMTTFSAPGLKAEGKPKQIFCCCRCDARQKSMSSRIVLLLYLPRSSPTEMGVEVASMGELGQVEPVHEFLLLWASFPSRCPILPIES